MLTEDGRFDDAMRWARVAVEEMRNRPEPHDTLGWIYLKNNQPVEALAEFSRAADLAPRNTLYRDHVQQAKTALDASR
jgi:Flp pilus assembly protein TadD